MQSNDDITKLLVQLAAAKQAEEKLSSLKVEIQTRLVEAMEARNLDKASATLEDGTSIKGTLVKAERVIIKEDDLKANIGSAKWKKVTREVLDKAKLEAAVAMGIVDADDVAAASEIVQNKPFVKVTGRIKDEAALTSEAEVAITNSAGHLKPAARRRVVKPKA